MSTEYKNIDKADISNRAVNKNNKVKESNSKDDKKDPRKKALCALYISLLTVIVVMIMWGMIFETVKIQTTLDYISSIIDDAINSSNWLRSCGVFLLAQLLFHLLWVPGLTFFNALVGFYMENTFYAFLFVYVPSLFSCLVTYFVARYIFKSWCLKSFLKQRVFRAFFKESAKTPWKTSALVRCMFIPVATKNYLMPLLNINFVQYAVPAALFYIPYLGAMVLFGANLSNFRKVTEKHGWSKMNGIEKFQYLFTMCLG